MYIRLVKLNMNSFTSFAHIARQAKGLASKLAFFKLGKG